MFEELERILDHLYERSMQIVEARKRAAVECDCPGCVPARKAPTVVADERPSQPMTEYECPRGCRSAVVHELHPSIELRCNAHSLRMFPKETAEVHRAISRINSGDDKRLGSAQYTGKGYE